VTRGRTGLHAPAGLIPAAARPREGWLYRQLKRNPLIFREILAERENKRMLFMTMGLLLLIFLYPAMAVPSDPEGAGPSRFLRGISLLLTVSVACWEGSRLLPSPSQGAFLEALLSTPLSGMQIVLGGMGVAIFRLASLVPLVLISSFLGALHGSSLVSAAAWLLLIWACVLLSWGLSVWSSTLLRSAVLGASSSFLLFSLLFGATVEYFLGGDQLGGRSSLVTLVFGEALPGPTRSLSGYLAACGLVLVLAFAVWFRRGLLREALRPR